MEYNIGIDKYRKKYFRRLQKRLAGKPFELKILMSRTFSSAIWILSLIEGLPFEKLTMGIYFMCQDLQFREIVRMYDAQLELAGIDEEKFVFGLHRFYNEVVARIKREGRYAEFAEFLGAVIKVGYGKAGVENNVADAYKNLVLQTMEYLRPNKLDLSTCVYGVATTGGLLTGACPYAFSDIPAIRFQEAMDGGRRFASRQEAEQFLLEEYRKVGIVLESAAEISALDQIQRIHINTTTAMLPFINEYTFDLVPTRTYGSVTALLQAMTITYPEAETLRERLRHRRRTLPTNGVTFQFHDRTGELKSLLMKEVFYSDSVHFLYKLNTKFGELAGYYDTESGFLYSIAREANDQTSYERIQLLLLVLYASQVLDEDILTNFGKWFRQSVFPVQVQAYGRGGKLRNTYAGEPHTVKQRDPEKYDMKVSAINGFIRRLPAGQTASEEARELAARYGYELGLNETYVRPFVKHVFVQKTE